ncbi:hypothetical protein [Winogradskyella sp. 3972H.M.0a.05]|uniref:hypothetical protein n=1 Tax=Winogradskyella sp. 3972H.M.0a.05 TaxID=2950277 RepID=UPI00339B424F
MKKLTLLFLFCSLIVTAQRDRGDWTLGFGVNTVNSNGKNSPFNSPEDWAFGIPISISLEHNWTKPFSIEQSISINQFNDGNKIDGNAELGTDLFYFSTNTKVKWYFDDYIFPRRSDWFDLALSGGVGIFTIEGQGMNTTGNVGLDAIIWFDDSWGIALKSMGKFAFGQGDTFFLSNHFQHFVELVYNFD